MEGVSQLGQSASQSIINNIKYPSIMEKLMEKARENIGAEMDERSEFEIRSEELSED